MLEPRDSDLASRQAGPWEGAGRLESPGAAEGRALGQVPRGQAVHLGLEPDRALAGLLTLPPSKVLDPKQPLLRPQPRDIPAHSLRTFCRRGNGSR